MMSLHPAFEPLLPVWAAEAELLANLNATELAELAGHDPEGSAAALEDVWRLMTAGELWLVADRIDDAIGAFDRVLKRLGGLPARLGAEAAGTTEERAPMRLPLEPAVIAAAVTNQARIELTGEGSAILMGAGRLAFAPDFRTSFLLGDAAAGLVDLQVGAGLLLAAALSRFHLAGQRMLAVIRFSD
jgi:hypothetical protein